MKSKINWSLIILSAVIVFYTFAMFKTRAPKKLVTEPQNIIIMYNTGGAEKVEGATLTKQDDEYLLHIASRPVQMDSTGAVKVAPAQTVRIPQTSVKKMVWGTK